MSSRNIFYDHDASVGGMKSKALSIWYFLSTNLVTVAQSRSYPKAVTAQQLFSKIKSPRQNQISFVCLLQSLKFVNFKITSDIVFI